MIGQQPGRAGPVARRLGVPDGLGRLAVPGEPLRGPPVQHRHFFRSPAPQLQPQQIREQVVVAEPGPPGVERYHERVRVLQVQQDRFRARAAGQQVGQLAVDPVEQRGAQQQILDVGRLAVQHLGQQVLSDGAVAAGKLRHEPLRIRVPGQRDRREPQARRPPLGPLVQQRRPGRRQRDTRGVQQLAGLPLGEPQLRRADLGQLTGQAQLMQTHPEVAAGRDDGVRLRREVGQQAAELSDRLRRGQLVGIVDNEDDAITVLGELGQHPVDHGPPVEVRRRGGGSSWLVPKAWRTVLSRSSQTGWASCWSRRTCMTASRCARSGRSAQARSSDVFPLPAGAEMTVTFRAVMRSRQATRSSRAISGWRATPWTDGGWI